jgi:hypothetical protein
MAIVQGADGNLYEVPDGMNDDGLEGRGKNKKYSNDPVLQKLAKVSLKQGEDIRNSQVTYLTIFDSIDLVNNPVSFDFFKNLQNKNQPLANLPINRFEDGKAMAIETVTFMVAKFGTPPNGGLITNLLSIEDTTNDPTFPNFMGLALGTFNITISQQTSIESIASFQQLSNFNPAARHQSMAVGVTGVGTYEIQRRGYCTIHLPNPIIIAPNQNFVLTLNTAAYEAVATTGQYRIYCTLAGRGVLAKVQGTN